MIFVATPPEVVDEMLKLADVKKSDLLYDLGCGDGIIVVTAAKKIGCKAVGYDIDPDARQGGQGAGQEGQGRGPGHHRGEGHLHAST